LCFHAVSRAKKKKLKLPKSLNAVACFNSKYFVPRKRRCSCKFGLKQSRDKIVTPATISPNSTAPPTCPPPFPGETLRAVLPPPGWTTLPPCGHITLTPPPTEGAKLTKGFINMPP
ncbi:unnamed protein product, partial [Laminaria digitata]